MSKDGFEVCEATPCEVLAAPNETFTLEAKKGAMKGSSKVLAQKDRTIKIKLTRPRVRRPPPSGGQKLCEVDVDGLKILRPCK